MMARLTRRYAWRLRRAVGAAIQWFLDAHESHARAKWRGLENPDEIARRKGVP